MYKVITIIINIINLTKQYIFVQNYVHEKQVVCHNFI